MTVSGRVLRPDGAPAVGARLYSYHANSEPTTSDEPHRPVVRGTSDAEGRFRIDVPKADLVAGPGGDALPIVAASDGLGIDWSPVKDPREALALRLVPDQPISGRVVDSEGRPVTNATIRVRAVQTTRQEKLDDFFAAIKSFGQDPIRPLNKRLHRPGDLLPAPARTDAAGRFRIAGAGAERVTVLEISGPTIAQDVIYVIGRAGFDPTAYRRVDPGPKPDVIRRPEPGPTLHGPTLDFVATPAKIVEGTVLSTDGQPIAGARVSTTGRSIVDTTTDAAGRFRLAGVRKQPNYDLWIVGDQNSAWLPQSFRATDSESLQPVRANIHMVRGVVVSGRVIDSQTGDAVQAALTFVPLPGNAYYGQPGYESYQRPREHRVTTAADGSYRLPILPGLGVLMAQARGQETSEGKPLGAFLVARFDAEDGKRVELVTKAFAHYFLTADKSAEVLMNWNAVKVLDLAPHAAPTTIDLHLRRGKSVTVTIQDADGKPVTGAIVGGTTAGQQNLSPLSSAECTFDALEPPQGREVVAYHPGRSLAKWFWMYGDATKPKTIRLEPTGILTGRVLDTNGHPVADVEVNLVFPLSPAIVEVRNYLRPQHPPATTDADGRFRLTGVIPEMKVSLSLRLGESFLVGKPPLGQKEVKPGATVDLGDCRTEPRQQ